MIAARRIWVTVSRKLAAFASGAMVRESGMSRRSLAASEQEAGGNGSVGSSRYWAVPVTQARPVIVGDHRAARPATSVVPASRPGTACR